MLGLREQVAESLMPPNDLKDYNLVLPLPLQQAGQSTPARLAIGKQKAPSGEEAIFIRADLELHGLGSVSVRLHALDLGPIAITLLVTNRVMPAMQAAIGNMAQDLEQLGIEHHIRLEEWLPS